MTLMLFVAGVHGAGKTFTLKPACEALGIRHATASELIKEQRGLTTWTSSRQVDNIEDNQKALISALQRLKEENKMVVLDGHFILRRAAGVHQEIGVKTFTQLMIREALLLEASTATVATRLWQRGDLTWDDSEIESFARKEMEQAKLVCRKLNIPLTRMVEPSVQEVQKFLEQRLA